MSNQCNQCGSYAINHHHHGRDGSDPDLCDVCYWHTRNDQLQAELAEVKAELSLALKVPSIAAMHTWLDSEYAKQNKQLGDELAALKAKAAGHLVTDGGRNQRYIGFFEGETPEQREERLAADQPQQTVAVTDEVRRLREALESAREHVGSQPVKTSPWHDGNRSGQQLDDGAMDTLRILNKIDAALSAHKTGEEE